VSFSVTLRDKATGLEKLHEFGARVPEIPVPDRMDYSFDCDISVIQLTVEYPWQNDWPQFVRLLETCAFRESDFDFIDVTDGPLTDIALQDSIYPEQPNSDIRRHVGDPLGVAQRRTAGQPYNKAVHRPQAKSASSSKSKC